MKRLLFYNDARRTGGHEKLMVEAVASLSERYAVWAIVSVYNEELCNSLRAIAGVEVCPVGYASDARQVVRNFFSLPTLFSLCRLIRKIDPCLVVGVQGTIDTSFLGVMAGRLLHISTVSYVPFAFRLAQVSSHPVMGRIKDKIHAIYYHTPGGYITLNDTVRRQLEERCPGRPVRIAHNGLRYDRYVRYPGEAMRQKYGLPEGRFLFGLVGRFECWHKGLDFFLDFLDRYNDRLPADIGFVFVGDGRDRDRLLQCAERHPNVSVLPWSRNISEIYSLIDALILPSRFEGVPLTVLEALHFGCPVIASDIDGVKELLPDSHRFPFGRQDLLLERLADVRMKRIGTVTFDRNRYSMENFCREFGEAIDYYCKEIEA